MESAMALLNSCAEARLHPRLDRKNSEPRRIAVFATDAQGERAVKDATQAAGVSVLRILPETVSAMPDRLGERPDLIVVVGSAGGTVDQLPALYDLAGKLGILLTAVLLSDEEQPQRGPAVEGMRRNTDMLVQATDEDFLALMLHWLERSH
ncbi:hypothetical protein [Alkalilacustris brevis]|uniref:hypothetical protein n=1 Tax=Alkalilacustris brevis TaxID=2026338 RepID=UPI000E0D26F2|nr:hypothetical protein [Alkalilacustris brevis]